MLAAYLPIIVVFEGGEWAAEVALLSASGREPVDGATDISSISMKEVETMLQRSAASQDSVQVMWDLLPPIQISESYKLKMGL